MAFVIILAYLKIQFCQNLTNHTSRPSSYAKWNFCSLLAFIWALPINFPWLYHTQWYKQHSQAPQKLISSVTDFMVTGLMVISNLTTKNINVLHFFPQGTNTKSNQTKTQNKQLLFFSKQQRSWNISLKFLWTHTFHCSSTETRTGLKNLVVLLAWYHLTYS